MDQTGQNRIKSHFENLYRTGITPWKDHPPSPVLTYFLKYLKEKKPNAKLLDIGCGDGWISIIAAQASFAVWGIDGSQTAIANALKNSKKQGLKEKTHFQLGDALALPYSSHFFDALIDRGLFHHILPKNRKLYFKNIFRVLKDNSFIYLSVFSLNNPEGIGQQFTEQKISDYFSPHFIIDYFAQDPYPTPAPAHLLHFILRRV